MHIAGARAGACLKHIVLGRESKVLAGDGEGDIRHLRNLLALHQRLAGCKDGQRVAQRVELRDDLLLCLVVGQRDLRAGKAFKITEFDKFAQRF